MPVNVAATQETQPARGSLQGARKIVTVLFADVVGSTLLAESLDPEEWAEIVGGMHARVSECITRFDGMVAQLLGDGVLAFFGAPATHEDDPERAVAAALDLISAIAGYEIELQYAGRAAEFKMRIGLNTGLVVVGNVGAGSHVEYLAVGDTVNLAARMQSMAEPATVLLAEATARAVRHAFELAPLGAMDVKGKSAPVPVYRVIRPKARGESKRGITGLASPIVGRDREIDLLASRMRDLAAGQGQIIAIVGEAGLGKSRLMAEVVAGSPAAFVRAEGRCISFAGTTPYTPIIEALTQLFGLDRLDDDQARVARLRARLAGANFPFIATLLGLPLQQDEMDQIRFLGITEPGRLRERMMRAIVATFEDLAQAQPLALMIEDLHWADSSTLDVLEQLLAATERSSLAVVTAFRPGALEPSWRFHEVAHQQYTTRYTPVFLEPLTNDDSRSLVGNLLYIESLPASARNLILAKAEGNPFYVEEIIRGLLDAGLVARQDNQWRATRDIADIALPDSVAGIITARLDRLSEDARAVLQTAAVLGRDFSTELVSAVADPSGISDNAIAQLVERELIQVQGEGAYRFKHALTQEAAYNSMLLSKRRGLHRRAAEALAAREGADPAVVASHFLAAQDSLRALPFMVAAGERALAAYSTPEALALFRQASEIAGAGNDTPLARRAFEGLGTALILASDPAGALANYGAMESYALTHGDDPMRVSALNKMAFVQSMWLGQFDPAETYLNQARDLAQACHDRAGLAEGLVTRCNVSTARAKFEEAVQHLSQLVQVGRELGREFETAFGLVHSANTWTFLARFDRAWQAAQEAREYAEQHGDLLHLAQALSFSMAWCYLSFGDLTAAYASGEQAVEISARIGDPLGHAQGVLALATVARLRGDYDLALAHLEKGVAVAQQLGLPFILAMMLAAVCSTTAEMDPARVASTQAMQKQSLALLDHPMGVMGGGMAWADLGECAMAGDQPEIARQMFEKGLSVRTPFMYLQRPRCLVDLARVHLATGETEAAGHRVAQARLFVEERQMAWYRPLVALAEAEVKVAFGQPDIALDCCRAALALADGMGMQPIARAARRNAAAMLALMVDHHS